MLKNTIWLLSGRELRVPNLVGGSGRWAPTARLGSMFGYGVGSAIASRSCTIGPFLAVTGTSLRRGSPAQGVLVYLAYAAGIYAGITDRIKGSMTGDMSFGAIPVGNIHTVTHTLTADGVRTTNAATRPEYPKWDFKAFMDASTFRIVHKRVV